MHLIRKPWAAGRAPRIFIHGDSIARQLCFSIGLCVPKANHDEYKKLDHALNPKRCHHWQYLTRYETSCCQRALHTGAAGAPVALPRSQPLPPAECASVVQIAPLVYNDMQCVEGWLYEDLHPAPSEDDMLLLQHGAHAQVDELSLRTFEVFAREVVRFALRFPGMSPILWVEPLPQHFPTGAYVSARKPWEANANSGMARQLPVTCVPLAEAGHRPQYRRVQIVRDVITMEAGRRIRLVPAYHAFAPLYNHHPGPFGDNNSKLDCTHYDQSAFANVSVAIASVITSATRAPSQPRSSHVRGRLLSVHRS